MIFWGAKNIAGECSLKIPYRTIAVKERLPVTSYNTHFPYSYSRRPRTTQNAKNYFWSTCRINSAANQVVTKNVVRTDPDFIDKLVTLRMNEKFMAHVQKFKYKGKTNLIPDIENVINKSSDNLWMDDKSLFEELIMSV